MDSLLTAVGNSGGFVAIQHGNKTYNFYQLTDAMRARLTTSMHLYYISSLQSRRNLYSPKVFRELQSDLERAIANSYYTFGSSYYFEYVSTDEGAATLLKTLINADLPDEELMSLMKAKGPEVSAAIATAHGLKTDDKTETGEGVDPKASTPAGSTQP